MAACVLRNLAALERDQEKQGNVAYEETSRKGDLSLATDDSTALVSSRPLLSRCRYTCQTTRCVHRAYTDVCMQ